MTHRIVIDTLIADGTLPHWSPLRLTILIALPITLGLSCLTYFVIEKPFLELRGPYRKNVNAPPLKIAA
jgi:peptidoglycan/LPS O-acetylase OafA/YrhL